MPASSRAIAFLTLGALLGVLSCGDNPVSPPGPPGIVVLSGAEVTDTVGLQLSEPLVVEVRDAKGKRVVWTPITFVSTRRIVAVYGGEDSLPRLWLGAQAKDSILTATDSLGRASVLVKLGTFAGDAGVVVHLPSLGMVDTAHYTITPGTAVSLVTEPEDTSVYVGSDYALRTQVTDSWGNVRSDTVSFSTGSQAIELDGGGQVRGHAYGRARVEVRAGDLADTVQTSVVPPGVIAALRGRGVLVFQTDGSGMQSMEIPDSLCLLNGVQWKPGSDSLVFSAGIKVHSCFYRHLFVVGSGHAPRRVIPDSILEGELDPFYDPSGEWIYFTGAPGNQNGEIWRVHGDGTGAERVGDAADFYAYDGSPAVSPDGLSLVYATNRVAGAWTLRTLDLATRATHDLPLTGEGPRWSPDGSLLAFRAVDGDTEGCFVANADGSGRHQVAPGPASADAPSWSPDGNWLVVAVPDPKGDSPRSGRLALLEVATGTLLPLSWSSGMAYPAWYP